MWPFANTPKAQGVFLAWDIDEGRVRTVFWTRPGVLAVVRDRGVYEYVPPKRLAVVDAIVCFGVQV
jgi:hypothetical protein